MAICDEIEKILTEKGASRYGRECVSQLQHALQCATLAENAGADYELVTAALLHDVGHLVDKRGDRAADGKVDRHHETIGGAFLSQWFDTGVTEPVALHVPAKQYLCAVDPRYFATLSPASVRSLALQGGSMDTTATRHFMQKPYADDAVQLRQWDDAAKNPDANTPPLSHFLTFVTIAEIMSTKVVE